VIGPEPTVEHAFMSRCSFPEAAGRGIVQRNSGLNVAAADRVSFRCDYANGCIQEGTKVKKVDFASADDTISARRLAAAAKSLPSHRVNCRKNRP
jgi:hypothetical protein